MPRDVACDLCPLSGYTTDVCMWGEGPTHPDVLMVTRTPISRESRIHAGLTTHLERAGIDVSRVYWTAALKCEVGSEVEVSTSDIKACAEYLREQIERLKPRYVLALGNEAWQAVSGKSNIMRYRGSIHELKDGILVFPTVSQAMVYRKPSELPRWRAELAYFARLVSEGGTVPADHTIPRGAYRIVNDVAGLTECRSAIRRAEVMSFDVETVGRAEYDPDARIVSLAMTLEYAEGEREVWAIPLYHPESPFEKTWRSVLRALADALCRVPIRVAHNGKYDCRWLRRFEVPITHTHDSIIQLALIDENGRKSLKIAAPLWLGAEPWGVDTGKLLDMPLADVLEYNGLDTWHTLRLWIVLTRELNGDPRTAKIFETLSMPLVQELIDVEASGIYVDRAKLDRNWETVKYLLGDIEDSLMTSVPPIDQWPTVETVTPKGVVKVRPKFKEVNFNASNFARWWLFEHLGLPVLAEGKTGPSMSQHLLKAMAADSNEAKLLVERTKWNKLDTGFFGPWSEQLDIDPRLHTTFKPWGTVTGRLSSGKEDADKVVVPKGGMLGVNLQQIPRMKIARGVFGAPPGHLFISADYSQLELRLAAFIARERHMMHLYQIGADIHREMAMAITGKTDPGAITYEERTGAKASNFGYVYGMGWFKFIELSWNNYSLKVTEEQAQSFRKAFFDMYPDLPAWHDKQRRLAHKYKRVLTPMGRVRHLPDIDSPDKGTQGEAERQAINSPVQAFGSDITSLSLIGTTRSLREHGFQTKCVGTVHDALLYEAPVAELPDVLPLIKLTMENPPLSQFGVELDVPLIADIEIGPFWGEGSVTVKDVVSEGLDGRLEEIIEKEGWLC